MKILSICFLLLFISGCKKRQLQIPNISTEYIDFFALSKKDINDIPDKCIVQTKYIKILPDSADLLFSEINKIQISNHKIYILDKFQRLLGIYDMSGKGIGKVGNVERAPEEYLNLTDFSINKDGNIHIIDGRLDKMNIYDKNLNFITSQKLPFEADIFQCLDDGGYLFGLSSWNKQLNSNDKIVKTDSMLNSSIRFCEYEKGIDPNYWISFYQFLQTEKYIIRNHFETESGIGIQGLLPTGDVTIVKCGGECLDEYYLSTGTLTENTNFINMCRTQVRIKMNTPAEYFLKNPLGNHHILIQGNYEVLLNEFLQANTCKRTE